MSKEIKKHTREDLIAIVESCLTYRTEKCNFKSGLEAFHELLDMDENKKLTKQRDDLLKALKDLVDDLEQRATIADSAGFPDETECKIVCCGDGVYCRANKAIKECE